LQPAPDVLFRKIDGELVLLSLADGRFYALDAVGTRIWELLVEHQALARVLEALVAEFDIDQPRAAADLLELSAGLRDRGLLRMVPA
jgi:hypothetical protein